MDQSGEMSASEMSAIRNQMDETRSALAEKIELLEKQVTHTVQDTVQTVQSSVQSVGNTVESVKSAVGDTVESVKHAVEETVNQVKTSVQDGVHAVGEALSIAHHVEKHPWPMMAGAMAVGFVGGYMLLGRSENQRAEDKFRRLASSQGRPPEQQYGAFESGGSRPQSAPLQSMPTPTRRASQSTMGDMRQSSHSNAFMDWFRPASQQMQSLAIGATLAIVRDMISKSVPKPLESQIHEFADGLTSALGGQVIQSNLLDQFQTGKRG